MPIRQSTVIDLLRAAKAYRALAHQIAGRLRNDRPLFMEGMQGSAKDYNLELVMTIGQDFEEVERQHFIILERCDMYYTDTKIHKNDKNREEQTSKRRFDGVPLRHVASREKITPQIPNNANTMEIRLSKEKEEEAKLIAEQMGFTYKPEGTE